MLYFFQGGFAVIILHCIRTAKFRIVEKITKAIAKKYQMPYVFLIF
jgi:hypothetical protein